MWAIFTTIVDRLGSCTLEFVWGFFARHAGYVQNLEDNLTAVETTLISLTASKKQVMRRVLFEEQQKQKKRLDLVALWFELVDKAMAEGEELIKRGDQELQRLCLGGYCSSHCWSTSIFGKEVDKFLNLVRDLLEKPKEFEQVTAEVPSEELVAELPCDPTVGLETKFAEVWSCLENKDVVGMYGIGGVGKTTLLTQLHNKFVDIRNGVLVIWVVVGKDTPPEKIQENIAKKIGFPIEQIFNKLRCEKFVLFLDDIWKRVDLTKIGIPTQEKLNGSKIIFSTRSSKVCHEMRACGIRVETLEHEDSWELFRKHAGEDTINIDPEIPPLAKIMANKCGGLPIALKVIGRAMAGKLEPREWRYSLRILREPPQHLTGTEVSDELLNDMEVEVFEILKFSFDSLPNDKWRSCFLYCALYPEDFCISRGDLVDFWICEDFWDSNGLIPEARDEAYSIIDTLIRSCLLEDEGVAVKMHDVIRDMALWLEKNNVMVMAMKQLKEVPGVEKWEGVKRLSLMANNIKELTQVPLCHDLVTLFLNDNERLHEVNEDFFHFMGALTVLDLSFTNLRKLPKSIEKLVSLRYLNISMTLIEELPVELAALSKLMSLSIAGLRLKAKRSDGVISGISSLQILKMSNCSYRYREERSIMDKDDEWTFLDELDSLEHLKELEITIKSVNSLARLKRKSPKLLTAICLEGLPLLRSLNICLLGDMKYLSNIAIRNSDIDEIHYAAMETRESAAVGSIIMSSSTSLHMETLISFRYIREVAVMYCKYLKDLTVMMVLLPNLTRLQVVRCDRMEEIISAVKLGEEVVDLKNQELFSKLNVVVLQHLPELRCMYQNPRPFPLLRYMYVKGCPLLKKLPLDSSSRDGPKINLSAYEEWWKAIEWKDDATKAALLPRFKCKFF